MKKKLGILFGKSQKISKIRIYTTNIFYIINKFSKQSLY